MTLNHRSSQNWFAKATQAFGKGLTAVGLLVAAGALTAGCLDRPIAPATPQTTNVYISQIRSTGVDKIDLLFMIDNSISMSDKQQILSQAVPVLVSRLITPTCVDKDGMPVGNGTVVANDQGICPAGSGGVPEFKPIQDIHIGVITSSLGDHGSHDVCSPEQAAKNVADGSTTPTNYNDLGQLLPTVRTDANPPLHSWANSGFLVWDPRDQTSGITDPHPGLGMQETNKDAFITAFTAQVTAAGEHGCGYEASLEAWYRFLVDPEPVSTMGNDGNVSVRPTSGTPPMPVVNATVLAQRDKFLRYDSLLAIVMMSDENDCSIIDEDGYQGWLVGYKGGVGNVGWRMPRASSACAANPNDKCCRPCLSGPAAGCPDNTQDSACMQGEKLTQAEDSPNERCYNQVKRFGIDLLYPTNRYVDGLKEKFVTPRFGGAQVPNPIYKTGSKGEPSREQGLVFIAGLIGVPWQDVSTPESWPQNNPALKYMTAQELLDNQRWPVMLGDPIAGTPPTDPLMIESIDPRPTGAAHPLINAPVVAADAPAASNPINGKEQAVLPARDDLQFACVFDLGTPVSAAQCGMNSDGCDCNADEFDKHSPLCQGVTADNDGTQIKAKAYPGVRELQVLRDYGTNSIVASICPKNIKAAGGSATADPNYGYNPAVAAIVDRLKEALTVKCLPRPLSPATEGEDVGKVPCAVVEVRPEQQDPATGVWSECDTSCPAAGRLPIVGERAKVIPAAREYLRNEGICGDKAGLTPCDRECFCELQQFTDTDLRACQTGTENGNLVGYCYVDPSAAAEATPDDQELIDGENNLVKDCPAAQRRILRFVGQNTPAKDGLAFIACIGATAGE